ncbi:MAG: hypothetical protein ACK5X3_20370 [Pseudomonadota bacterium]
MPITLTITGEDASHLLQELEIVSRNLIKPKIEWRQVSSAELDVRMAADLPSAETLSPDTSNTFYPEDVVAEETINPEDNAVVIEDKPKRKRRTKEEMEAERAAGLPPQEGDPDLETVTYEPVDDIMSDVVAEPQAEAEEKPAVIRREDLQTLVGKIIRNRKLSPAELKQAYIDIGGAPQLAAIDGAHMEALYNFLAEKLQA